jgi:hypothetical protein
MYNNKRKQQRKSEGGMPRIKSNHRSGEARINTSSARGFGNNKNNIIWDSGDVIRWIEAKDLLINKFKSVNVYNRISYAGLIEPYPEVTFDKVLPTRQIRVLNKINALTTRNDESRDTQIVDINAMVTANNIDANERARMLYKIESEHRIQQNRIDTTEYEKQKLKSEEDTAKVN